MLLRIALELDLKRAMIGGVDKVYEIGRTFRNEGLDSTHAAEFSMLEAYEAYGDQFTMMELTKALVLDAARAVGRTVVPARNGGEIDLEGEWRQASILDLVSEAVGEEVTVETPTETLRKYAAAHDVELQPKWGSPEIVVELYEQLVEDHLINPTFVMDYPSAVKPLAKPHRSRAGRERGLGPDHQRRRAGARLFRAERPRSSNAVGSNSSRCSLRRATRRRWSSTRCSSRRWSTACPPPGGMGMGVDRLVMLLTGAGIRETILFPLLRPE